MQLKNYEIFRMLRFRYSDLTFSDISKSTY